MQYTSNKRDSLLSRGEKILPVRTNINSDPVCSSAWVLSVHRIPFVKRKSWLLMLFVEPWLRLITRLIRRWMCPTNTNLWSGLHCRLTLLWWWWNNARRDKKHCVISTRFLSFPTMQRFVNEQSIALRLFPFQERLTRSTKKNELTTGVDLTTLRKKHNSSRLSSTSRNRWSPFS